MPHEPMDDRQVAAYLHMDQREVHKLASRGKLPCRRVGGRFIFTKSEIDHWAFERMGGMKHDELARLERGVSLHHGFDHQRLIVNELIPTDGLAVPLGAKTRESVLRGLLDVAEMNEMVYVRDELLAEIKDRETLCSTAIAPGVALPHPRHPLPYDIAESFVVVGLTPGGIPFGAEDGGLTRLFFLICCKDDRTHLHVLARLARMLSDNDALESFLQAETPDELGRLLLLREQACLDSPH
ncbi:MAG: PTS sugar transporter subunit IIA [Planctomycetota bacterium]